MIQGAFHNQFSQYLSLIKTQIADDRGEWTVKGFIDRQQRIYTISLDTKVLSKVLELLMYPTITSFANEHGYDIVLARVQNHYPDISLISKSDESVRIALDIKTTYIAKQDITGLTRVSGMTLGTFGGYFRNRYHPVSSTFAYNQYKAHFVLGVVYQRKVGVDERKIYKISDINTIPSVAHNFHIFLEEKYKIASDSPGSGNTKNIGSTKLLERLLNGTGVFSKLGIDVFDDYWMNYQTRAMARENGFENPPYHDLRSYRSYKQQGSYILQFSDDAIESELDLESPDTDGQP